MSAHSTSAGDCRTERLGCSTALQRQRPPPRMHPPIRHIHEVTKMTDVQTNPESAAITATYDAVIVGAGFAGMYMLHKLRGLGFTARVYDAAGGVGGTWYWNRYPGARCDVKSVDYSFSFDP